MANEDVRYPEHAKLESIRVLALTFGRFIEWLEQNKELVLAGRDGSLSSPLNMNQLLAEFFELDIEKIEAETRAMWDELRLRLGAGDG